jgi:hypothetical protein
MPSIRSQWTAERQCASIMMAMACSIGSPWPIRTACLTARTTVGELLPDLPGDPVCGVTGFALRMEFVDHLEPECFLSAAGLAGHQHPVEPRPSSPFSG